MVDPKFFDEITKKLFGVLPDSVKSMRHDIENNIHAVLQSAFTKLDLVTRKEFDVQAAVLAKTRTKLEILEEKITTLEQQLKTQAKSTKSTTPKNKKDKKG